MATGMAGGPFTAGNRVRPRDSDIFWVVTDALETATGWRLYLEDGHGTVRRLDIPHGSEPAVEKLPDDGAADPHLVLAGLWAEWMRVAAVTARATALASTPLRPYMHQDEAVYGAMLPQPQLRFLLADEPGTGKTIMAGLYLREMQRLGFVRRALIVAPAHLVSKWQADFDRFFGGGLMRITADTAKEGSLRPDQDMWIVSLDLAAVNASVQEEIRPDRAGWDVIVIDEAHRLTPTAESYYRVGRLLSAAAPRVLLMTATPHRGKEWLFRALMHLVDPDVFPPCEQKAEFRDAIKPGGVHFLRRIKEELVDFDGVTPLFKGRHAWNIIVPLNAIERGFYNQALDLVDKYFPLGARPLAKMVYGKRAASSLYALYETLRRRREQMGTALPAEAAIVADPEGEDPPWADEARVLVESSTNATAERAEIDALLGALAPLLEDGDSPSSKWPRVRDECLLPPGIGPGKPDQAVIFTEYADTADSLLRRFRAAGFSAERYSGRDNHEDRDKVRDRFARGEFQVLVSTDAGNEGIDLQSAHVLVNWDIPWSLVRLEQRMGRIHRVGQTREVELFNVIATDTREGEVLQVLLDNLVTAANRLEGKLFDSLSLVVDLVAAEVAIDGDLQRLLTQTYTGDPDRALGAARAMTAARLEAAARAAAAEENRHSSGLNVEAATARLRAEALERVNPRIVEAFLAHLAATGAWSLQPSAIGEGVFILARADGRSLPSDLSGGQRAIVASSGAAITRAVESGASAHNVVSLGPAELAFRSLIDDVVLVTRPALLRGGVLTDPTSVTRYDLFVFEADIVEIAGKQTRPWSVLIRVDDAGARPVRWELLANLEASGGAAGQPHPARAADAHERASQAVRVECDRRARDTSQWLSGAQRELQRLPAALSSSIADGDARRATRRRLESAVEHRLTQLRLMSHVRHSDPRTVGWARVEAAGAPMDPTEADSEDIAMTHVAKLLRGHDWRVADVHTEGRGFDLLATRGRAQRCIEVKGIWGLASSAGVRITGKEILIGGQLGDEYWLYVVDDCQHGGRLFGTYPNPIARFENLMREIGGVSIPGSALAAAREEVVGA
jgi:superfamily II DNA or RNA helicase